MPAAYTIDALSGNVQFGKGGPRVKDSSGVLQLRVADDSAFAKGQCADPTVADDIANKRYVDSVAGTPTWAAVLGTGAASGANDPIINDGRSIIGDDAAAANAGSYIVRGGNYTAGTGSFTAGKLTVKGGDNASTSGRPGDMEVAGGDNDVTSSQRGGDLLCRAGRGGIGGDSIFAGGNCATANAGGAATFQGGDNTGTGRGGAALVHGGDCIGGSGSDVGGPLTMRGGQARGTQVPGLVTIQGGQPDTGGSASRTGHIVINTAITVAGSNRQTGDVTIESGTATATSVLGRSGHFDCGTGDSLSGGISGTFTARTGDATLDSGDMNFSTGDSDDGDTGTIRFRTGNTASNDANDLVGDILFITGNRTNTGSDANSRAGNVTITLGFSANPNTTGPGGSFSVTAGAGTANSALSRGGTIDFEGGDVTGTTPGAVAGGLTFTSGSVTNATGTPGDIRFVLGTDTGTGIGNLIFGYATWPQTDGSGGTVLSTDGAGVLSWIAVAPAAFTTTKTANYTAASNEHVKYDPSGPTFTLTMPASPSTDAQVGIKNVTAAIGAITLAGGGNPVEDPSTPGSTAASVSVAGAGISLIYQFDGTVWWIV